MANQLSTTELRTSPDELTIETRFADTPERAIDQFDAVAAYRAFDDGALAEVPLALAAYVSHQQQTAI